MDHRSSLGKDIIGVLIAAVAAVICAIIDEFSSQDNMKEGEK